MEMFASGKSQRQHCFNFIFGMVAQFLVIFALKRVHRISGL